MADQAGDAFVNRNRYPHNHEKGPQCDLNDPIYTYPSVVESQIQKLKHGLEHWREIILCGKKVFFWEKQWHPIALLGCSTIVFTLLWLLNPSVLTVVSTFGLLVTLCDYSVPYIAGSLFKPEMWTTRKEQEYEEICMNIVLYKARLELLLAKYCQLKITNRKMYFGLTVSILASLAWVGCTFNNLFLMYSLVTFLLLLPGMEHNGIIQKWGQYLHNIMMEILRQKPKVQEKND